MELSNSESSKFEINEIEIVEEAEVSPAVQSVNAPAEPADIHHNLPQQEAPHTRPQVPYESRAAARASVSERVSERANRREHMKQAAYAQPKEKKYHWAFFLCMLFLGVGVTATTDHPIGVMWGLGFGFLFFVDPIYQKVMQIIERL